MELTAKVSVSYSPSEPSSLFLPPILYLNVLSPFVWKEPLPTWQQSKFTPQTRSGMTKKPKNSTANSNTPFTRVPRKWFCSWFGTSTPLSDTQNDRLEDIMGKFGHGRQNHRGEMLIDFCRDNELFITNTMFRHRKRRKVTWRSPDGRTANMERVRNLKYAELISHPSGILRRILSPD